MLLAMLEPLEDVRLLAQESVDFGVTKAQVTVFERDGIPTVLLRVTNQHSQAVWWKQEGGWGSRSHWSLRYGEKGSRGSVAGGHGRRGDSNRVPTEEELAAWRVAPGAVIFKEWSCRPSLVEKKDEEGQLVEIQEWSTSKSFAIPTASPQTHYGQAETLAEFDVWVNHSAITAGVIYSIVRNWHKDLNAFRSQK